MKMNKKQLAAIVVAAGNGRRMGIADRKQYLKLGEVPLLAVALHHLTKRKDIAQLVLVVPADDMDRVRREILVHCPDPQDVELVTGGRERRDSVWAGIKALHNGITHVAIHDGARPLVTEKMLDRVFESGFNEGAAILALPVTDTVKQVDSDGVIGRTVPRINLWLAQTPQVFRRDWLVKAYGAVPENDSVTDDAEILEKAGYQVCVVMGSRENIKITIPEDLKLAEAILSSRRQ